MSIRVWIFDISGSIRSTVQPKYQVHDRPMSQENRLRGKSFECMSLPGDQDFKESRLNYTTYYACIKIYIVYHSILSANGSLVVNVLQQFSQPSANEFSFSSARDVQRLGIAVGKAWGPTGSRFPTFFGYLQDF